MFIEVHNRYNKETLYLNVNQIVYVSNIDNMTTIQMNSNDEDILYRTIESYEEIKRLIDEVQHK